MLYLPGTTMCRARIGRDSPPLHPDPSEGRLGAFTPGAYFAPELAVEAGKEFVLVQRRARAARWPERQSSIRDPERFSQTAFVLRAAGFRLAAPPRPMAWALCARKIAAINPGKRRSSSLQRLMLRISTPRRSLRINPASLSALKCCESVDLGMLRSLT